MKEYFNNKNTLVLTLFTLLGLSIMDIVMRRIILEWDTLYMIDFGEQFVTAILAILLIIFAVKGKDRLFYIVCGGWLAYYVLSIIFIAPALVVATVESFTDGSHVFYSVAIVCRLISMFCIVVIGGLLVKYMSSGTICNKAFNASGAIAMLSLLVYTFMSIFGIIDSGSPNYIFSTLFGLTTMTMVFLFTFFAYDSAKTQLSKTQL